MLYYRVKPENDQKRRYKFGRRVGLVVDGIYIGGELFTPSEVTREYRTHLVGMEREKLFDPVEISKRRVYWSFGARFAVEG